MTSTSQPSTPAPSRRTGESDGLRQYSCLDRRLVTRLIADETWSNEGIFAFLQGIRRLTKIGGDRVDLPTVELEIAA